MDQNDIKQLTLSNQTASEEMKLISFEVYQEIMDRFVGEVLRKATPVAGKIIHTIENDLNEEMSKLDKESVKGAVALGIWADISVTLNNQVIQQGLSEDSAVQ